MKREKAKMEDMEKITATKSVLTLKDKEGNIITGMDRGPPQFQATSGQSTWLSHKQYLGLPN